MIHVRFVRTFHRANDKASVRSLELCNEHLRHESIAEAVVVIRYYLVLLAAWFL